jgi:ribonucleoside-diphosphate reductase beta chain
MSEQILQESEKRYTLFPIEHNDLWDFYKTHQELYWTADEVDLSNDLKYWNKLSDDEKHFIKHILAFFAASDGIVLSNLLKRFTNEVQYLEAEMYYTFQAMIENVHSEMYSRMIEALIKNEREKIYLFNAIDNIPAVKKKADWAIKWISSDKSFATRLVAFAIVEGLFFSGSFCAIDWIKERKLGLTGLCDSNDFISRDEGLHCKFAVHLYNNHIENKLSETEIFNIIREAVDIEKEFITVSLPCSLLGMNSQSMKEYIEFVANRLCCQLKYNKIYPNAKQPFPFMEIRNLEDVTNFFDKRNNSYKRKVIRDYGIVDVLNENEDQLDCDKELDF